MASLSDAKVKQLLEGRHIASFATHNGTAQSISSGAIVSRSDLTYVQIAHYFRVSQTVIAAL